MVVPEVLVRSLVAAHQVTVEARQPTHKPEEDECVAHDDQGRDDLTHGGTPLVGTICRSVCQFLVLEKELGQAHATDVQAEDSGREDEEQKSAVVALADRCAHPWTVVVKAFYTVVIHAAVMCPRWLIEVASVIVADEHTVCVNKHLLCPAGATCQVLLVRLLSCDNSRVSTSSQEEKHTCHGWQQAAEHQDDSMHLSGHIRCYKAQEDARGC
mmetsp:Transcript_17328/g.29619  ORF Transcript_17328/g.29619 Transcript_17328/m.29619 type:complete len:213 (+) Transcript_17328:958-1596(+)